MNKNYKLSSIDYLFYFLVILVAAIQFRSILTEKPFWMDEWYVISSLKFRNVGDFLGDSLDYCQAFPRVYLVLIKFFSGLFDYSFLSLRIIPFIVQILAFLLYSVSSSNLWLSTGNLCIFTHYNPDFLNDSSINCIEKNESNKNFTFQRKILILNSKLTPTPVFSDFDSFYYNFGFLFV